MLEEPHRRNLASSALPDDVIEERGYRSVTRAEALSLGFGDSQARDGLLIPIYGPTGRLTSYQLRPDSPRRDAKGRAIKYETPLGSRMVLDIPPRCREHLLNTSRAIWITEGIKKADALAAHGAVAIGLLGVHNFRGQQAGGGKSALPEFEQISWEGRAVYIAFDSDAATNRGVCDAMARIGALCASWGADPHYVKIPTSDGSKVGIDDYLAANGSLADLLDRATTEPPKPPAPPMNVEVLDDKGDAPKAYALTDSGNAERLVDAFGENLRWSEGLGRWLIWDGRRWAMDDGLAAPLTRYAQDIVRSIIREAALATDADRRKILIAHATKSDNRRQLRDMVELAKAAPGIAVSVDDLDQHAHLLNVANGTLCTRTFEMRPHRREDLITRLIDIPYDHEADCARWVDFLDVVLQGDQELMRYVWKAAGYSLTGETSEKCFFFLHGNVGDNGKSTFIETLARILGEYAMNTPAATLYAKVGEGGIPNDLARLRGVRMVTAAEAGESKRLDEELVKQLTGGDRVSARFMRAEWFDYLPAYKIWMTGNHRPIIRGQDPAIWGRVKLIPFTYSVPKERQDRELKAKFWDVERAGILAWMIEGCMAWRKEGLGSPSAISAAVAEYREDMDDLGEFLRQKTIQGKSLSVAASALYTSYEHWAKANGMKAMTSTAFGRRLVGRGVEKQRGKVGILYLGLALVDEEYEGVYRGGE